MPFLQILLMGIKGYYIKEMEKYDGESRLYETNFPGYANRNEGEGGRILSNPQEKMIWKFAKRDFLACNF